jgi:nicotinate-nucleotide pyrophosphorylase (carboxylating)
VTIDPFARFHTGTLDHEWLRRHIEAFLAEDVGPGDVTVDVTVPADARAQAVFVVREPAVVAGLPAAAAVFSALDPALTMDFEVADGASVDRGAVIGRVEGAAAPILTGERLALNLLQRMSGIATLTRHYVDAVVGTGASISDTRKTTPGLRELEKYAVRIGGGRNHRFGLFDAVLVKDNHIAAAGGLSSALQRLTNRGPHPPVQVEVESLAQLEEAMRFPIDALLLDNMPSSTVAAAVKIVRARPLGRKTWIEASGGITLDTVRNYAETGVDTISVGELTHSAPAIDIALDFAAR